MTVKLNSLEGGTDETAITAGNSGGASGDAYDSDILLSSFDTLRAAHGSVSCRCSVAAASSAHVSWATSGGTWYGRLAFYLPSALPANLLLVTALSAGTARIFLRVMSATLKLSITSSGFADLGTSTTAFSTGAWQGLEFQIIQGGPAANLAQVKLYTNADFATPAETLNASSTTISAWDRLRFGANFAAAQTYDLWQDDLGISDVGYLGATGLLASRRQVIAPGAAVHRAASW